MSDSPPPAYSQIADDPFVFSPTQPSVNGPPLTQTINPRVRYGYGPDILAPEDLIRPSEPPINSKFYVVPICPEPGIVDSWLVANELIVNVPCGTSEAFKTWDEAVVAYSRIYDHGGVKVTHPRPQTSTPGHPASTPFVAHSATATPSSGARIRPITFNSSPAATPSRTSAHGTVLGAPILIDSSPAATPGPATRHTAQNGPPLTPTRDDTTIKLHKCIDRHFEKLTASCNNTRSTATFQGHPSDSQHVFAGPSMAQSKDAVWIDPTPVSIPRARLFSPVVIQDGRDSDAQDGCDPGAQDGRDSDTQDGRDPDSESDDAGSDDEYFINFRMTPRELAALANLDY